MKLSRSAAIAAVAVAVAGSAGAMQMGESVGVGQPMAPVAVPSLNVNTIAMPTLPGAGAIETIAAPTVVAPAAVQAAAPAAPAAPAVAVSKLAANPSMAVITGQKDGDKSSALASFFENGQTGSESSAVDVANSAYGVAPHLAPRGSRLSQSYFVAPVAHSGYGAYYASNGGIVDLIKRAWNVLLGVLGIGVTKAETPQIMAQRIKDELQAQKVKYNNIVANISERTTLVEMKEQQFKKQMEEAAADAEYAVKKNDDEAAKLALQKKSLAKVGYDQAHSDYDALQKELADAKTQRDLAFAAGERQLVSIEAGLGAVESAKMKEEVAGMKADFGGGSNVKELEDRFQDAVDRKVAHAKGIEDSANSSLENRSNQLHEERQASEVDAELEALKKKVSDSNSK